jgi:long-chain acyl-CoA synthetase
MPQGTLVDLFYRAVDASPKPEHLLYKKDGAWRPVSSEEFRRAVEELSAGLVALGVRPGDRVAILSENRPEWAFADLATLAAAAIDVPIYPSLTPEQVLYNLGDSGAGVVFVSTADQARKVMEVRARARTLQHVVQMDEPVVEGAVSLSSVRERGRAALAADPQQVRRRAATVRPEDVATIIYTSGTTGEPKGVMLTHANIVSNVEAVQFLGLLSSDLALSFLPLCHIFERMAGYYTMLRAGASIAYAEGFEKVADNMAEVRPTIMCSVPRLYEKMYARIRERIAGEPRLRRQVFHWAVEVGRRRNALEMVGRAPGPWLALQARLADRLAFAKIRARTGGRLRVFVSGGAALAPKIAEFFGAAGLAILEGYGLTETSPVITCNRPGRTRLGTVGLPLEGVEVRIGEDGEILTRGPHVMKGYYNKPQATSEAIDAEGWFHTGDVGQIDADGFLAITDRKKDLIVTSGGKKVAPQPIENALKADPYIAEVVMVGDHRHFPSALVVPNFANLERWAREQGLSWSSREELLARPEVVRFYEERIAQRSANLARFEQIKKITLLPREFSLEAGELTPTLKVRRRVVEQKYKALIDRMYEDEGSGRAALP